MISFFYLIGCSQALQAMLGSQHIGSFTTYQMNGVSTSASYNNINIIFPSFFTLEIPAKLQCTYNAISCTADTITNNQIVIKGFVSGSKSYELIVDGLESGQFEGQYQLVAQFNSDTTIIEEQQFDFQLTSGFQVLITFSYLSNYSFTETEMTMVIKTCFKVIKGTILELIFPILNVDAVHEQSQILDNPIFKLNNIILEYIKIGSAFQFTNLFQNKDFMLKKKNEACESLLFVFFFLNINLKKDHLFDYNSELTITVADVYTKNLPIISNKFNFQTFFAGKIVSSGSFYDYSKPKVSESRILKIECQTNYVSQMNILSFTIQPRLGYPINSVLIITFNNLQTGQQIALAKFIPKQNINPAYLFQIVSAGFIISQFNSIYDSIVFQFDISDFINPLGLASLDITVAIQTNDNILIENSSRSIVINPTEILGFEVLVQNTTIFATTLITINIQLGQLQTKDAIIYLGIPSQIDILPDSLSATPKYYETIQLVTGNVEIQQYFYLNQNLNDFSITFMAKLAPVTCDSDSFEFYTYEPTTSAQISRLLNRKSISITKSSFSLNYFSPQQKITDYLTDYNLIFLIPQVQAQSDLEITLPEFYSSQVTTCSAQIDDQQYYCQIHDEGKIKVKLMKGGVLQILLNQIQTERSVSQYQYNIQGVIQYNNIIQSELVNGDCIVTILTPQSFDNYLLTISNLFYGQEALYTFSFYLNSTIIQSDILELQVPQSLTGLDWCDSINAKIIGSDLIEMQIAEGLNTIKCNFLNPRTDDPIFPFEFNLKTRNDNQIATFKDQIGIRDPLRSNSLDFSFAETTFLFNHDANLSLIYSSAFGVTKYGKVILILNSDLFNFNNLLCLGTSTGTTLQNFGECQQDSNQTATSIIFTAISSIKPGENILRYTGLQLASNTIGTKNVDFTLLNMNQFGAIMESRKITQSIQIKCNDNCLECYQFYNKCTKCPSGYILRDSTCQKHCPSGSQLTDNSLCLVCITNHSCLKCNENDITECIECLDGYNLINGYCIVIDSQIVEQNTQNAQSGNTEMGNSINKASTDVIAQTTELYDGIPIIVIIMSFFFAVSLIKKIFIKQTFFIKSFYLCVSLLDIPVAVVRFIRFAILSVTNYYYLSLSCFGITILIQVLSSSHIQYVIKGNFTVQNFVKNQFWKSQLMIILQWRVLLSILQFKLSKELLLYVRLLFKISLVPQIASIIILISFMLSEKQFYLFALDDSIFNLTLLFLSITNDKWISSNNSQTTVYPSDQEQQNFNFNEPNNHQPLSSQPINIMHADQYEEQDQ